MNRIRRRSMIVDRKREMNSEMQAFLQRENLKTNRSDLCSYLSDVLNDFTFLFDSAANTMVFHTNAELFHHRQLVMELCNRLKNDKLIQKYDKIEKVQDASVQFLFQRFGSRVDEMIILIKQALYENEMKNSLLLHEIESIQQTLNQFHLNHNFQKLVESVYKSFSSFLACIKVDYPQGFSFVDFQINNEGTKRQIKKCVNKNNFLFSIPKLNRKKITSHQTQPDSETFVKYQNSFQSPLTQKYHPKKQALITKQQNKNLSQVPKSSFQIHLSSTQTHNRDKKQWKSVKHQKPSQNQNNAQQQKLSRKEDNFVATNIEKYQNKIVKRFNKIPQSSYEFRRTKSVNNKNKSCLKHLIPTIVKLDGNSFAFRSRKNSNNKIKNQYYNNKQHLRYPIIF